MEHVRHMSYQLCCAVKFLHNSKLSIKKNMNDDFTVFKKLNSDYDRYFR